MARAQPFVLVADSHPDCRGTLAMALEFSGFRVRTAETTHQALAMLREATPSAVVMDGRLQGLGGIDLARVLRANPRFDRTRLILTTTWLSDADAARIPSAGVDRVFLKPLDCRELARSLAPPAGVAGSVSPGD